MAMKLSILLIGFASLAVAAQGGEWKPSDEVLHALRAVESGNGAWKVGDNGASLGDFQLSEAAWLDVNSWRKAHKLKTYEYSEAVLHGFVSRVYASNYLSMLHAELTRKLK